MPLIQIYFFGRTDVYTFTIDMGAATALDISGWAISGIQLGNDGLTITGDNDAETISGSIMGEIFNARNGDDIIAAGGGDDIILAGGGADAMDGGAGEDTVDYSASSAGIVIDLFDGSQRTGDAAGDTFNSIEIVLGTAGNNTFIANADGTAFIGNGGSDRVSYENANAGVAVNLSTGSTNGAFANGDSFDNISVLEGSAFNDTFNGSSGADCLEGEGGDDTLIGRAGADRLYGDNGNDSLNGGGDNDQLFGGNGDDMLNGSIGDDRLTGGAGADDLIGGTGARDRAEYGSAGPGLVVNMSDVSLNTGDAAGDTFASLEDLFGSNHGDNLTGNGGVNWLFGRNGNDTLNGAGGQGRLFGGDGDDVGYGGEAGDELQGGEGNDTLYGEAGADKLIGDAGNDTFIYIGGAVRDDVYGEGGIDTIIYSETVTVRRASFDCNTYYISRAGAQDLVRDVEFIKVSGVTYALRPGEYVAFSDADDFFDADCLRLDDELFLQGGDDVAYGRKGNDLLYGGDGNDALYGGEGNDQLYGEAGDDKIYGDGGNDRLYGGGNNDKLSGGNGNDRLFGNNGDDRLFGNAGDDSFYGFGNNDVLDGGAGNDQLFGGVGADMFYFSFDYDRDTIYDFEDGVDLIDLRGFTLSQIGDALNSARQVGLSVNLDFGNGDILQIRDMNVADITMDDFIV